MRRPGRLPRSAGVVAAGVALCLTAACAGSTGGASSGATARASGSPSAVGSRLTSSASPLGQSDQSGAGPSATVLTRSQLLHPAHKYFGVSVPGVPASLVPLHALVQQIGKRPNIVSYYQDWTRPLNATAAKALCTAGVLPDLTWESWSWNDIVNGAPSVTQPAYSPRRITSGAYDSYIRSMARSIKALKCPVMLRLDQEANGHWYPWGVQTPGMHNTAAQYVALWRHVWKVFHAAGVRNVLWTWSPNFVIPGADNNLRAVYPGNKYVDLVGIDGYVLGKATNPATLFAPTLTSLATFAASKPWMISETGVAAAYRQPSRITRLLKSIAANPKLIGVVYLDQQAARANWSITATRASTAAFKRAIGVAAYGRAPLKGL